MVGAESWIDKQRDQSHKGALPRALGCSREVYGRVDGLSEEEGCLGEQRKGSPGENTRGGPSG